MGVLQVVLEQTMSQDPDECKHERRAPWLGRGQRCLRCGTTFLQPLFERCSLQGWQIGCQGILQYHHIITKGMAQGNKAVREILRACPPEIMVWVCEAHHMGQYVNSPEARALMLWHNVELHGYEPVRMVVDGLPWKVDKQEWTLERMLLPRILTFLGQ